MCLQATIQKKMSGNKKKRCNLSTRQIHNFWFQWTWKGFLMDRSIRSLKIIAICVWSSVVRSMAYFASWIVVALRRASSKASYQPTNQQTIIINFIVMFIFVFSLLLIVATTRRHNIEIYFLLYFTLYGFRWSASSSSAADIVFWRLF